MFELRFLHHSLFCQVQVTSERWIWFWICKLTQIWGFFSKVPVGENIEQAVEVEIQRKKVVCQHEHSRSRAAVGISLQNTDLRLSPPGFMPAQISAAPGHSNLFTKIQLSHHHHRVGPDELQRSLQSKLFCDSVVCDHGWKQLQLHLRPPQDQLKHTDTGAEKSSFTKRKQNV